MCIVDLEQMAYFKLILFLALSFPIIHRAEKEQVSEAVVECRFQTKSSAASSH